jgi:hypothetical protein
MKPAAHVAASAVISGSIYLTTQSATVAGISFLSGFLIDVDHVIDYIREYGLRPDIGKFLRVFDESRFRKVVLLFHAWELIACLFLLSWLSGWNEIPLGICIGAFQHLVLDQFVNGARPWGYFFIYRATKRFTIHKVIREAVLQRKWEKTAE